MTSLHRRFATRRAPALIGARRTHSERDVWSISAGPIAPSRLRGTRMCRTRTLLPRSVTPAHPRTCRTPLEW